MQVLLVAHNPEEREILTYVLKHAGLAVGSSVSLQRVADKWLERPSDLVVVAWHDGAELRGDIINLRAVTQSPLLLILNPPQEETLCDLLRAGADVVLARPVAPRVLTEYTRAILRRTHTVPTFVLPRLNVTEVSLDPDTRMVSVLGGESRRLTQLEFRLLYVLMVNRGQVIPVEVIVERVWGYTGQGSRDLVRGLISRLRRKIEPDLPDLRFIQNVPGIGYRFSLDEDE
jgi:DNA-binding response OmpR family regulator